jgi:hypothetical protein
MSETIELAGTARPAAALQQQVAHPAPAKPQLMSGSAVRAIVPTSIEETFRMAKAISIAGWAPKSYQKDGAYDESKIVVGIMHGLELGLTPIAALQSIAVINGTPSIWGDGALAIVQASGLMTDFREEPIKNDNGVITGYTCTAKRRGIESPISHTFTDEDAKAAGLLGKSGPWQQYRARMLQMRARAWTLRAGFADVLRGLSFAEEAQDIIDVTAAPVRKQEQPRRSKAALDAFAGDAPKANPPNQGTTTEGNDGDETGTPG